MTVRFYNLILYLADDCNFNFYIESKKKYLQKFTFDNSAMLRLPLANEIADTCLYLSSDKSSAITGQCINVDCGVLPS